MYINPKKKVPMTKSTIERRLRKLEREAELLQRSIEYVIEIVHLLAEKVSGNEAVLEIFGLEDLPESGLLFADRPKNLDGLFAAKFPEKKK
jgi:hypothetical protein